MLPIRMIGTVVRGFGRGSKDLGIPTANLDPTSLQSSVPFQDLPSGIYWGYAKISSSHDSTIVVDGKDIGSNHEEDVYTTAISIGYNPTYGNDEKTVEPHCIAPVGDPRRHASSTGETLLSDFYDKICRLSVVEYLRPQLPFEGLPKLVEAIKGDIAKSETLGESQDPIAIAEKEWVKSSNSL